MKIVKVDEKNLVEVSKYVSILEGIEEHKCKACPSNYKDILYAFGKMIKHPDDEVLMCVEEERILGVLALLLEPKDKYMEAVGGVYAKKNYNEVAMEFYRYIEDNYKGFHFDATYPEKNNQATEFMEILGAKCNFKELEMVLNKKDFRPYIGNKDVISLEPQYYEKFTRFHDETYNDAYWNGHRLLEALDKFHIFISLDLDKIVGEIVLSKFGQGKEEIYFLKVDEDYRNLGYGRSLLGKSIEKSLQEGIRKILAIIELDNTVAINIYQCLGFKKGDITKAYSIECL